MYATSCPGEPTGATHQADAPRPLCVAEVSETYPPEPDAVSLAVERTVRYLLCRGHRVEVVRPRRPSDRMGLVVPPHGEVLVAGSQLGLPALAQLLRRWRRRPPDVVHLATQGPLAWAALLAARHLGIPAVSDARAGFVSRAECSPGWFAEAKCRAFHTRAAATVVPSVATAERMAAEGCANPSCVGRGVDAELFSPRRRSAELRASWGAPERQLTVLCVAVGAAAEKAAGIAREAFLALRRSRADARLVWIGDGPAGEWARGAAAQIFAGRPEGLLLAEHYASADLLLHPAPDDGSGTVLLEAMASGLPIVAFDDGAAREHLVDGASARLVRRRTEDFVRAVQALALQDLRRRAFGIAARRVAQGLTWSVVLARLERVLGQVGRGG